MEACAPAPLFWAGRLRGLNSPSSSVAATRCRGSQGRLGLVAGTSVPARTGPAPTGPWRRSLPGGRELPFGGASGLSRRFRRSVIHPTRLETRTKESNTCASLRVVQTRRRNESEPWPTIGRQADPRPASAAGTAGRRELVSAGWPPGGALAAAPVAEAVSAVAAPTRGRRQQRPSRRRGLSP